MKEENVGSKSTHLRPLMRLAKAIVTFYCDTKVTAQLATELGSNAVDAGPLTQARLLEPFALLWISLAFKQGFGFHWSFKILK
jgi:hypothetical protein